jgi:cytochrome c oxidase assembly protein subunit 11
MADKPDRLLTLKLACLGVAMFVFGFVLVPFYDVFCAFTGMGGKTAKAAVVVIERPNPNRTVRVEFLGSVARGSAWQFEPEVSHLDVHPGQLYEAQFRVRNLLDTELVGQAVPSVAPGTAARYFNKTECFCFTSQKFQPHEERELKVVFMLAPELPADEDTVSLSYTYFAVAENY